MSPEASPRRSSDHASADAAPPTTTSCRAANATEKPAGPPVFPVAHEVPGRHLVPVRRGHRSPADASRAAKPAGPAPRALGADPAVTPRATGHAALAHPGIALALILVAVFMVVLDFSIVNVALPSLQRALGFTAASLQWVATAYAISFGGLLILGGRAADLFGRRRLFVAGLVLFALASLAGGMATDPLALVAARAVQGIGGAIIAPASLSLLTTAFAEGPARTRALGLYGATASTGFVAGLLLGGVLVQFLTWRAVLWVNVPVGAFAALLAPRFLDGARPDAPSGRLDLGGAGLVTASLAALVYAVSEGPSTGWATWPVAGALAVAVTALAAFLAVERRHPHPLVRLGILRQRTLRSANAITVMLGLWSGGEVLVMTLYLQIDLHYSPLWTGLALAPQGAAGLLAGLTGARLAARLGIRKVLMLTTALPTLGFLVLWRMPTHDDYLPILLAIALVGFGTAGSAFATAVAASAGVADHEQGLAGGLVNTSRQIGAALGVAVLVAIAESVGAGPGRAATVAGDRIAMLVAALAALAGVVIAWRGIDDLATSRHPGVASERAGGPGEFQREVRAGAAGEAATPGALGRLVRPRLGAGAHRPSRARPSVRRGRQHAAR